MEFDSDMEAAISDCEDSGEYNPEYDRSMNDWFNYDGDAMMGCVGDD